MRDCGIPGNPHIAIKKTNPVCIKCGTKLMSNDDFQLAEQHSEEVEDNPNTIPEGQTPAEAQAEAEKVNIRSDTKDNSDATPAQLQKDAEAANTSSNTPDESKPKRTRRTRAQIDADESSDKDSEEVADSENSNQ